MMKGDLRDPGARKKWWVTLDQEQEQEREIGQYLSRRESERDEKILRVCVMGCILCESGKREDKLLFKVYFMSIYPLNREFHVGV